MVTFLRTLIFLLLLSPTLLAQQADKELAFTRYLIQKKNFDEAIYVLNQLKEQPITKSTTDSINFFLGNIYYSQQQLTSSIYYFDQVSSLWPRLHSEAVFFSAFNSAYLKKREVATEKLTTFQPTDSVQLQLLRFELAGLRLLERNFPKFDSLASGFGSSTFAIAAQEGNLLKYRQDLGNHKRKSPLVAGLLSAVIPGAGKFYAGQKGQGIYTLLISAILGLQAWEGYQKSGPQSFRFIAYTSLFTSLYVGTIWGSAFSVKLRRDQFNETIDNQILFDMHIPLRTVFH